jgi:hypothetical protein
MAIRKLTKNKNKKRGSKSRQRGSKSRQRGSKSKKRGSKVSKSNKKNKNNQRGGFFGTSNCSIASVTEKGFNLATFNSGNIKINGFSLPDQKAIIYDPKCPPPPSQAGMF